MTKTISAPLMMRTERTQAILETFIAPIERAESLYDHGRRVLNSTYLKTPAGGSPQKSQLAWLILSRATQSLRSVVNLFLLGSELDAAAVFRTIVELYIDYEYIWRKDTATRAEDYLNHGHVVSYKRDDLIRRVFSKDVPDLEKIARERFDIQRESNPELRGITFEQYEDDRKKKHDAFKKGRSWTAVPIGDRVRPDQKDLVYNFYYGLIGCNASHSGGGMVAGVFAPPLEDARIPDSALVVFGASLLYLDILARTLGHFDLRRPAEIDGFASELGVVLGKDPVP